MNIGFDATAMFGPGSKNRGIGNYSVSLFSTMIQKQKEDNFFMLNCVDSSSFFEYIPSGTTNFKEEVLYTGERSEFVREGLEEVYGDIVRTFIERNKIDVFIITSPFEFRFMYYKKEWFEGVKVSCIVYDIIPYMLKKEYLRTKESFEEYMRYLNAIRFCDRFMVISQSVKDDMVKYVGFEADKIDVIYGAYDAHFETVKVSDAKKRELYERFSIRDGFIMCTGGDDFRKNIDGLIEAYAGLPSGLRSRHQLVVVCKMCPESVNRYTDIINSLKLTGSVILTNFVSTEDLINLYNLAYLMAFPSKYEGFGLPVVEAWACSTPVLTSNNSSLGEIAGDGAITVDPFYTADITRGLKYALTEADLPKLLENGQKRNREIFNWPNVAGLAYNSLKEAVKRDALNTRSEKKYKIAMFTPLPPLQSGIADYTLDIITCLSERFDIDVFIDDGYKVDCELPKNVSVYNHGRYALKASEYLDTVYQIGNSEFHIYMYKYIEKFGGTVEQHDYNMRGIAMHLRATNRMNLFKQFVEADYSGEDAESLLKYGANPLTEFNGLTVNPASRVIVHDTASKKGLLARNPGKKVYVIPLYSKPEKIPDNTADIRKKYGYKSDDIVFAAFGIIANTKRAIPLINAFARIAEQNPKAKLLFCGKKDVSVEKEIDRVIAENGVSGKVKITGYIGLDEFVDYIDVCDVCFNLRYPYNGESSGSLTRILAKGKPVVVNRIGSFDEVPDKACIKLKSVEEMSPEEEIDAICGVMSDYLESPEIYDIVARNGRKYAEDTLDIKKIAVRYGDVLLASRREGITKKIFELIKERVKAGVYSVAEMKELAHTLAYAKNEV